MSRMSTHQEVRPTARPAVRTHSCGRGLSLRWYGLQNTLSVSGLFGRYLAIDPSPPTQ